MRSRRSPSASNSRWASIYRSRAGAACPPYSTPDRAGNAPSPNRNPPHDRRLGQRLGLFQQGLGFFIGRLEVALLAAGVRSAGARFQSGLCPIQGSAQRRSSRSRHGSCQGLGRFRFASSCSIYPAVSLTISAMRRCPPRAVCASQVEQRQQVGQFQQGQVICHSAVFETFARKENRPIAIMASAQAAFEFGQVLRAWPNFR